MNPVLIKKYSNRRLYCVDLAKYVSLTDIRDMIVAGQEIRVVEKDGGKDITKYILMQILLEERYEVFPEYFLRLLIQSPNVELMDQFFKEFLIPMMDYFIKAKTSVSNPFMPNPFNANPFVNPFGMNPFGASGGTDLANTMAMILKRLADLEKKPK